jgi:ERCC4-type nuclease
MFNVIVDTREQKPWVLNSKDVNETISRKLDTGDYSIEGLENIISIDRKMTVSELAGNVTQKRFEAELIRMQKIKHSFLLLEFSIDDILMYPVGSDIPKSRWKTVRVKGHFLFKKIMEIPIIHGVDVMFCGDRDNAEYTAVSLLKRAYEKYIVPGDAG